MKEIKIQVDDTTYDKAIEFDINIEDLFLSTLIDKVYGITKEREMTEQISKMIRRDEIETVFRVIKREIKKSKFDYVYKSLILEELDPSGLHKSEIENIIDSLIEHGIIKEEPKDNYKLLKKNYR